MGRMLTTKALRPSVVPRPEALRPASLAPLQKAATPVRRLPVAPVQVRDPQEHNAIRKVAFYTGLVTLFLRIAAIPEVLLALTQVNTRILYYFAIPAIFTALVSGALNRTFRQRASWYWAGFVGWMILATPFSSWIGGSVGRLIGYGRTELIMLFVVGGLAVTWKEVRILMYTLAAAALTTVLFSHLFLQEDFSGRFAMTGVSGTIGNSNDLAAQLILVIPFIWFVIKDALLPTPVRLLLWPVIGYSLTVILGTGSRGALVSLGVVALFILIRATAVQRALAVIGILMMLLLAPVILPRATITRLGSLFGQEHKEAEESGDVRSYLFKKSLLYTAQNPIFGVGPGQFSNYEGNQRMEEGQRGAWTETHNVFTQVSSEDGVPALLFFVGGLGSAFFMISKIYRRARLENVPDVANVAFCYLVSFIGYLVTIVFLAHAYHFQPVMMVGLAICIYNVATPCLDSRRTTQLAAVRS